MEDEVKDESKQYSSLEIDISDIDNLNNHHICTRDESINNEASQEIRTVRNFPIFTVLTSISLGQYFDSPTVSR